VSTELIAKHFARTNYEDLTPEAIEAAKKSILDIVGVMLSASSLAPNCEVIYDLVNEAGGNPECSILGFGGKTSCRQAAFVNGALTHAMDFDDSVGVEKPLVHPTGSTFPSALAISEKIGGVSGKRFITAIALGNDLGPRLASCVNGNVVTDYKMFPITTFGVFSATAVSCKLLELSESQLVCALGLALNRVAGVTKGLFGSELREIRDGLVGKEGTLCAFLAQKGVAAVSNGLEQLFDTFYTDDYTFENLTKDLGNVFRGAEVGFKPWPSCLGTHHYVQATLDVVKKADIDPDQVSEVQLRGNHAGYALYNPFDEKRRPSSPITAKVALPFVIGVAVANKDVTVSDFLKSNLENPHVLSAADKVTFNLDNAMGNYDSEVKIIMKDGATHSATVNTLRGSILDPMPIEDLVAKFKSCARHSRKPLTEQTVDQLVEKILNLEKLTDIKDFVHLLSS